VHLTARHISSLEVHVRTKGIPAVTLLLALPFVTVDAQVVATRWPSARAGHVLVYDPRRGETVLLGGDTNQPAQTRDSLWAWSGSAWRVADAEGPGWRTLPAAAYDSRRGRLVLFGGIRKLSATQYAELAEGDTWEWDGARWEAMSVNSPGPLDHHAIAFDEARGVMVVQGGGRAGRILGGATWTYDGTRWTMVADSNAGPGERVHHAMAYDSRRQRVVLFGGFGTARQPAPDVWEWDGTRWERRPAEGPGPRSRHRLAYDAARGVTVLYGGSSDRSTWTWDGVRWRNIPGDGPPATTMHAMAYDMSRERVVLYGGGSERQSTLWEWDGGRWREVRR